MLEPLVEGDESLIGRIDVHDAGDPLHEDRSLGRAGIEVLQGVVPMGVDGRPEEQVGITGHLAGEELVGYVDFGGCRIEAALSVNRPIQRQHHGLVHRRTPLYLRGDLLHQPGIPVLLKTFPSRVESIEVDAKFPTILQVFGDQAPATSGPDAGRVDMKVDEQRRRQCRSSTVGARTGQRAGETQ